MEPNTQDLFRIAMMLEAFEIPTGLENPATQLVVDTLTWVMREMSDDEFFSRYEAAHDAIHKGVSA